MELTLTPLTIAHRRRVMDIFNYYVEHSFAAYPEHPLPYEFFEKFLLMCAGYPAVVAGDEHESVIGFALLRAYNSLPVFAHTAELTCFVSPESTGKGVGKHMLDYLVRQAKQQGIGVVLAGISSLNEGSINFHRNNGFQECGRFRGIGRKKDTLFDIVYMQKSI